MEREGEEGVGEDRCACVLCLCFVLWEVSAGMHARVWRGRGEKVDEKRKFNGLFSLSSHLCQDNYKRRMHNLLYLEEYQQRVDMSR